MNRKPFIIATIITLFINIFFDRITKVLATAFLKDEQPISFFGDLMVWTYIENKGAFLSMGANWPMEIKYAVLLVIPVAVCLFGVYYCAMKEKNMVKAILLSTIIGGGLSNLFDRIVYNFSVIDFLNFGFGDSIRTGILNIADISVTFGVIILFIYEFKQNQTQKDEDTEIQEAKLEEH